MVVTANATPMQKILESKFAPYLGMLIAALMGLLFAYFSLFTMLCGMGGGMLIGVLLYMLPKSMGADFKKMAVFGVIFFVACSALSAYAVSKPYVESYDEPHTVNNLHDVQIIEVVPGDYSIKFTYTGDGGVTVDVKYGEVGSILGKQPAVPNLKELIKGDPITKDETKTYTLPTLEDGKIYAYEIVVRNSTGDSIGNATAAFIGPVLMDDVGTFCLTWNMYYIALYVMLIFFMILLFTTYMRKKLEQTRERLEKEGRLYPQGYGRCKDCGTIILPGEVTCRKCGAYIDVPEEMKAKKVEFFECSECGKEVPVNVDTCPSCGATFDGIEDEGEKKTEESNPSVIENPVCSECGKPVDEDAVRCPHCGERFDN